MFLPLHDDTPCRRTPVVTYILVAVNVLVFMWSTRLTDLQQQLLVYRHGFVPARIAQLSTKQAIVVPIEDVVQIRIFRTYGSSTSPFAGSQSARDLVSR